MAEENLQEKRPMLTDKKEWALIRSIYFDDSRPYGNPDSTNDPIELNDRMNHRPNRNQSR